jgi:hypothetical protein
VLQMIEKAEDRKDKQLNVLFLAYAWYQ